MITPFVGFELESFSLKSLKIESKILRKNPLGDNSIRHLPFLLPKSLQKNEKLNLVLCLAGFGSRPSTQLSAKAFEENMAQSIDRLYAMGQAPKAVYVFVDAWTLWGGSQFINSSATGNYEDYIVQEVMPSIVKNLPVLGKAGSVCIMGASSGGYGALHLSSKFPKIFGICAAFAPDSFFEASLMSDYYKAAPYLMQKNSCKLLLQEHKSGKILKEKNGFHTLNAIAMSACYLPKNKSYEFDFPIDFSTGQIKKSLWNKCLQKDPIVFLPKRLKNLKSLSFVYLEVGKKDEFHLQFGARKIAQILKKSKTKHFYQELEGGHFDSSTSRENIWKFLQEYWSSQQK